MFNKRLSSGSQNVPQDKNPVLQPKNNPEVRKELRKYWHCVNGRKNGFKVYNIWIQIHLNEYWVIITHNWKHESNFKYKMI